MATLRDQLTATLERRSPDSDFLQFLFKIINPITAAETAASVTPSNFQYPEGDIRRYGATTTASDNTAAINTALSVSGKGGNSMLIPPGTWKTTSQITVVASSSIYGMGESSILAPQGCNGLVFNNQPDIQKSRYFRDFQINATTGASFTGITINFTAASGNIVTGCYFQNLSIQNFGTGVFCRGLWMSSFIDCFLLNCYQGYYFHGQSIFVRIEGGEIQASGSITGTGDRIGINVDSVAGETAQSLHVIATQIDAYDIAVAGGPMLYNVFDNLDIAFANKYGFNIAATSGQLIIRDCAIQTNSASFATVGVNLNDLGGAVTDKVIIDGNWITANQANASSDGIYVGTNQQSAVITNNRIGSSSSAFANGIHSNGLSHNLFTQNNVIYSSSVARLLSSSGLNMSIGPDTIENGQVLGLSAGTPTGFAYTRSDSFTLTLTGMSAGTTGTCFYQANGHLITLSFGSSGISGTSNATTMTGTGLPSALWPLVNQRVQCILVDNGVNIAGLAIIQTNGVITFGKDVTGAAFTASGSKGTLGSFSYPYA